MTKEQVAARVGKLGPVPQLDKTQADICDRAVFDNKLNLAITNWDRLRSKDVPDFKTLPGAWQTVWLSRVYQGKTEPFGSRALAGKWQEAITALRSDKAYAERTNQEADLLGSEMPPPIKKPK